MPDMKSTGRALARLSFIAAFAVLPLAGCKTLSLTGDKKAAIESEEPEAVAEAATPAGRAKPAARAAAQAGSAYVDPQVVASGGELAAGSPPQTLPGSEEPAANIGGLATQPTGIKAYQSSIFSSGVAAGPEAAPRGPDGAVLPASAYNPAPGVNATLYSVYGKGTAPTGAPPPSLEE